MANVAINFSLSLVEQIINFTNNELSFQGNVAGDISQVKEQLKRMQAIVQGGGGRSSLVEEVHVQSLRLVGYRIEDALDGLMLHGPRHSPNNKLVRKVYEVGHNIWHWSSLHEIHEEIQRIRQEMDNIHQTLVAPSSCCDTPKTELQHHLSQTLQDAEILRTGELKEKLTSQLINTGERNCTAVVVVGPPGSGKTVLVNHVYSDKQVIHDFTYKIRIRVSRCFDVSALLSLLLSQCLDGKSRKISLTGDPVTDLKNNLQGKRYLVILDDVWSEKHWKDIKHALPDDSNGSRVLITTAKLDLASSIATSPGHIHLAEGLQVEESWQLFCRKAFLKEKGKCPPDLEEWSRKIVHKCERSPLAIATVGGLLSQKQRLPAEWRKLHENLRAEMESNPQFSDLNNSMLQSYEDLHGNLKSCLLYFSLFPEGRRIERARLIRLWVAEKLMNEALEKPAEEIAEEYLDELIRRNLVVANRDFDGRVKTCSVRIFLHYFLTIKSRKEDFADALDKPSAKPGENVRRLSVVADAFSIEGRVRDVRLNRVCTCIMFGGFSPPQVMEVYNQFKHLKVLDFQGLSLHSFPEWVVDLGLLRYLSLRGSANVSKVPSSIKKLRYLEFLDLKYTSITYLPKEICLLHNLQHLLVYQYYPGASVTFDKAQGMKMSGDIGSLSSLRKLTLLKAEKKRNFFDHLGKLTQLQKLGLIELRSSDGMPLCESLAKMKNLSVLDLRSVNISEFLELDYPQFACNMLQRIYLKAPLHNLPGWIKSLKSLVRIHLRWSKLTTSPINELQGLSNLIELQLVDAFIGGKLVFRTGTFEKLKVLHLQQLMELSIVEVSRGSMRNLQTLTLCKCEKLKTLPSGIKHLSELQSLLLYDMPSELMNTTLRRGSPVDRSKVKVYCPDAENLTWVQRDIS